MKKKRFSVQQIVGVLKQAEAVRAYREIHPNPAYNGGMDVVANAAANPCRTKALESGAADYIVKPFSPTELAARVQAALRGPLRAREIRPGRPRHRLRTPPGRAWPAAWSRSRPPSSICFASCPSTPDAS